jgi:hypothetical protein
MADGILPKILAEIREADDPKVYAVLQYLTSRNEP